VWRVTAHRREHFVQNTRFVTNGRDSLSGGWRILDCSSGSDFPCLLQRQLAVQDEVALLRRGKGEQRVDFMILLARLGLLDGSPQVCAAVAED
jgi:hypothetical protein